MKTTFLPSPSRQNKHFVKQLLSTIPLFILLMSAGNAISATMKEVQEAEEAQMQKFHLGMFYNLVQAGTQAEVTADFNSFAAHNLTLVMASNGSSSKWNWVTTAGNSSGLDVIIGQMKSGIPSSAWSDHAAMHYYVQNFLASINTAASCLKGYYLWDEPVVGDSTNLGKLQQTFFEEDPLHPGSACLIGQSAISACYSAMLPHDTLLVDVYGARAGGFVGDFTNVNLSTQDFTAYIDQVRGNINSLDDTPLWIINQTHLNGGWLREPTVNEIRCMNWLALAHGARGLLWFIWQTSVPDWGNGLEADTDEYNEISSFSNDIRSMESTLTNLKVTTNIASVPALHGGSQPVSDLTMQDSGFRLFSDALSVVDATASDGRAMRMNNDSTNWNIQWFWGNSGYTGSYTIKMRVRVDKTGNTGNAFTYGVYDSSTSSHVLGPFTRTSASASTTYQDITVGSLALTPTQYLYVAEANNTANVQNIYVDKMWLTGNSIKTYSTGDVQTLVADSPFLRADINAVAQDTSFTLGGNAVQVTDAAASDGYSTRIHNNNDGWNIQWAWSDLGFANGKEYDLWVRVKVDQAVGSPTGNAFFMGVYDPTSGAYLDQPLYCPASQTSDMVYKNIKVGTFVPKAGRGQCVFIAGTNNATNISDIYVDKFWFVGRQTAQDTSFRTYSDATQVADSDASDGYATRLYNDSTGWNIQWQWYSNLFFEPGMKYSLYATVKVSHVTSGFILPTGNALSFGVYDSSSSSFVVSNTSVPVNLSKDSVYRTYKIGTFVPNSSQYAYIAETNNSTNVPNIYVDKFFFVPEGDTYIIPVNRNVVNSDGMTVSFPRSSVDKYGDGNVTVTNVLTGTNLSLSGTTTKSFTQVLPAGGGMAVRVKSVRSTAR